MDVSGDNISAEEFTSAEEAIKEADWEWYLLHYSEKKKRKIYVIESANPDEDAPDHFDGNIIHTCSDDDNED